MAFPSRPKNHPIAPPPPLSERGGQVTLAKPGAVIIKKPPPTTANNDKYLPQWMDGNFRSGHLAEAERLAAERLLRETHDLIDDAKCKVKQGEKEVDTRFKQRVQDISFWKSELEEKLGDLKEAIESVESQNLRVEQSLAACGEPLDVVHQCVAHRNQRQGVDLCDDNVTKHLASEADTIANVQELLRKTLKDSSEEIRQLQKTKAEIEKDLLDKEIALDIDQQASKLKITAPKKRGERSSVPNNRHALEKNKQQTFTTPTDWQTNSEKNLHLAKAAIKRALAFQSLVDVTLASNASNLKTKKDLTDCAFERRIDEVKKAKEHLEQQLSETTVKIGEMDDSIKALERAIAAKQGPLATCQQKIQQRKQRPNLELVVDDVDAQLHLEAQKLVEYINGLELYLAKSKVSYTALQKSRLELENQIAVKANSIYIDEVKCMTIRQSIQHQAF